MTLQQVCILLLLLVNFPNVLYFEEIPGQHALLSWYPLIVKFESSGMNSGRWTEENEKEFSLRHSRNEGDESNNADGPSRGPLPTNKWQNSLRGSSDVHHAMLRIKMEALLVIEKC